MKTLPVPASPTWPQLGLRLTGVTLALVAGATLSGPALALDLHEVAAGVYAYHGPNAEANANNRGATSNVGVVIGDTGIAVIDTGGSLVFGLDLRSTIREISDKPVTHVINTHVHPDHVFGNAAFLSDEPEFVGHAKLAAAMGARAEFTRTVCGVSSVPPLMEPSRCYRRFPWPTGSTSIWVTGFSSSNRTPPRTRTTT